MSAAAGESSGAEDPFKTVRDAYGQVVENWSAAMERVVTTDEFAEASGRFLRQYAEMTEAGRSATRATADQLHLATKDDIARAIELVAQVERKVDEVSDEVYAIRQSIAGLEKGMDALAKALTKKATTKPAAKRPASTKKRSGTSGGSKA